MIIIRQSTWHEEKGSFEEEYIVDITKKDYTIRFPDGKVYYQCGPFQVLKRDWLLNNKPYEIFCAGFASEENKNAVTYYTPEELVKAAVERNAEIPDLFTKKQMQISDCTLVGNV